MLALAVLLLSLPGFALGEGLFDRGAKRVTIIAGAGNSFDDDYLILGVGAGYFVSDGLELGLNWQTWLLGDPSINQITPELTYVFRNRSNFDPYIGALYRWTFIAGLDDLSAYGGRVGVNISTGLRSYLGVGAVFMRYRDCSEGTYNSCSDVYPEFTFAFAF